MLFLLLLLISFKPINKAISQCKVTIRCHLLYFLSELLQHSILNPKVEFRSDHDNHNLITSIVPGIAKPLVFPLYQQKLQSVIHRQLQFTCALLNACCLNLVSNLILTFAMQHKHNLEVQEHQQVQRQHLISWEQGLVDKCLSFSP